MTSPDALFTVLITGATGAIGGALANAYAQPGTHLILHGRKPDALDELAIQCKQKGALVTLSQVALTDHAQLNSWLHEICLTRVPDIVIANAGKNIHPPSLGAMEDWEETQALLNINLITPLAMANYLAPKMIARGSGQLVFMSSLAAFYGLPVTHAYSASKAGVKAYSESLRGWLSPHGIGVSVVMPGYVESSMSRAMPGPKPWVWPPERAARRIRAQVARNKARICFPLLLHFSCWLLAALPASVSHRLVQAFGFGELS